MMPLIPLIGTVLALVQNLIVLTLGMKEGAIALDPLPEGRIAGEFPIQPWAEELSKERTAGGRDWPPAHCLPHGIPALAASAVLAPFKIIQEPDLVVILYEAHGQLRQIFLD